MQTTPHLPLSIDLESPLWLRKLRWVAILGMTVTCLGGHLYGMELPWVGVLSLLALLGIWNFFLPRLDEIFAPSVKHYVFVQIAVDLVILTCILWLTGGFLNPFVSFYVFHMMHAGLLLSATATALVAFICSILMLSLIWAPGLRVNGVELHFRDSPIWVGLPIGLIILIFCLNGFIMVFLYRLRRAQHEAQQRNKMTAIGRLAGGLAHELGTPLNTILVLAKDLGAGAPSDAARKELGVIYQQAKRCGDLVTLLLGYSAGGEQFVPVKFKFERVQLDSWLREIHPSLPLLIQRSPEVGESAEVPELVLRQVLLNIFKNAEHATGHLPNPILQVSIAADDEMGALIFRLRDNGPGFSEEARDQAFEAFFTTKEPGEGVGLGLYISYYLMEQIGGKISIDSAPGGGAEITVWVPYGK